MDFAMTTYKFIKNVALSMKLLTIYDEVCKFYDERMHYEKTMTRQVAQYIARRITCASNSHIGYIMGGKNYCTVSFSIDKIAGLTEQIGKDFIQDKKLRREISILIFKLKQSNEMNRQQTPNGIDFSVDYSGKTFEIVTIYPKGNSSDEEIREAKRYLHSKFYIPHGGIITVRQSFTRQLMPLMG